MNPITVLAWAGATVVAAIAVAIAIVIIGAAWAAVERRHRW